MADSGCIRKRNSQRDSGEKKSSNGGGSLTLPADYLRKRVAMLGGTPSRKSVRSSDSKGGGPLVGPIFAHAADWEVDVERTAAMLVLTAIHDIMKVESLLPIVDAAHAPYRGYQSGDRINDHDMALAYVLETFGKELPSFSDLPPHQQRTICFTQAKIGFNHGWLVQAEAPPHALFSKFKEVILQEKVQARDVAFYFVHWLTDLAGAVPAPLKGSEKFVVQFPHFVLESFIHSFPVINQLADRTETEVFETYLSQRWRDLHTHLGDVPTGDDAIALMRLVVQAQNLAEQVAVVEAYRQLGEADRSTLARELALTGIVGQSYRASAFAERGPAFLIYYSPAFLRTVAKKHPLAALQMLAAIYRGARELWPGVPSESDSLVGGALSRLQWRRQSKVAVTETEGSVTVRIDQLKDMDVEKLREAHAHGDRWFVSRRNDLEAIVIRHSARDIFPADLSDAASYRELFIIECLQAAMFTTHDA